MAAAEEQRVQDAVRRHARTRAFAEAEDVISAVLSDPGVQEARARVEAEETELGMELSARLQPFQDRYDQAVAEGDADRFTGLCAGKHGRWGGSASCPTDTRPRWRSRTGAATARAGRSRGWAAHLTTGERRWDRRQDPGAHGRPGVLCWLGPGVPAPGPTRTGVRCPGVLSCGIALECV
ncbi:hypothetical protein O1L60_44465 [Streptomyces diastatochromogenes]|nr:hypothetical protein [Streptomyces diastatochromogenes]